MFTEQLYRHGTFRTGKFWRARLGRYRLVGSKCKKCGTLWFPPRDFNVCGKCNARELEDYEFSPEGEITTYFSQREQYGHQNVHGYEVIGWSGRDMSLVKLKEGNYVYADIVDAEPGEMKDGGKVKMVTRKMRRESNGNWCYGYKFVLAGKR